MDRKIEILLRAGTNTQKYLLPERYVMQSTLFPLFPTMLCFQKRFQRKNRFCPHPCQQIGCSAREMGFDFFRERYFILVWLFQRKRFNLGLLPPGRCVNFYSTLQEMGTGITISFFKGRLPVRAYSVSGSHADGNIWRGHNHQTHMQGNPSMHTQSKQTYCPWTHSCSVPLQQAWRIWQCTHLLCRGRERTQDMGCKIWVLPFSSPESITCSWNKQFQTNPKFNVSWFLWTATLHIPYFTIQALHTLL